MSSKKQKSGSMYIPKGAAPESHELRVASILQKHGKNISFIAPNMGYKMKSADIYMDGVEWEIKSPKSSSYRSLAYRIHKATKQSRRIIFDTSRTNLSDADIMKKLRNIAVLKKSLQNLKIVTKDGKIIDIK